METILPDAPLEQHRLLRDMTDCAAKRLERVIQERIFFEKDPAATWIDGPNEKTIRRTLP
jgi:hypothetical protein